MITMIALNARSYRAYAEEEETVYEQTAEEAFNPAEESEEIVEMSNVTVTDNAGSDEEDKPIEEYVLQIEEASEELPNVVEKIAQAEIEASLIEEEIEEVNEETEDVVWESYTLYNYISVNEGKSYISLNTQENGISAPKSAAEFHKENGNKRYDLSTGEYDIADYDLTELVFTTGGFSFVEKSVAKEGQPYFIARLDRVEAVAAANFRASNCVEGIESFKSLDNSNITFHRNWYLTLITPMTSNKLLTGVRLGDGKNGNGDGKYYGIEYTENFQAVDSRFIPFGAKLSADQYSIADYDFTNLTLTYKGETYAYRPNGPVAGDGEAFHYYTVSFMKLDKLNKSTYAGGYLAENWPAWSLINSSVAGKDGYPYQEGYYHRDYQATLMVGDAPSVVEEESVAEEIAPVIEKDAEVEEIVEEIALNVEEETVVEEPTDETSKTDVIEASKEETEVEVIVEEENTTVENNHEEEVHVQETAEHSPIITESTNTNGSVVLEVRDKIVPQTEETEAVEIQIPETVVPQAAPEIVNETRGWALANLISALLSVLGMIFTMSRKEDKKISFSKFLGIIPTVLAILFFLLTEDMSNTMILADRYTLMMIIFPLVSLLTAWFTGNRKNKKSDLIESPAV